MRSSTLLRGLINFCNKYMSSLWIMWVHGLYALLPFRNFLASTVLCIALSHLESWCKPRDTIRSITHKPPYIFLKTATIPTYHGISITILRYIAMQLPPLPFDDLSVHCHIALHDHISDIVVVAQSPFIIFIHVMLDHCTSWYITRGIHVESYFS